MGKSKISNISADVSIFYCILRPQECNIPLSGKPQGWGGEGEFPK
jgi:hypothetical protein